MKRISWPFSAICLFALVSLTAVIAQQALPPPASNNLDRGIAAAREARFAAAVEYLTKAQEEMPDNPHIVFNLGLAHEKLGNTLTAAILLSMYLALPGATDINAVQQEVSRLEMETATKIHKIRAQAMALARNYDHRSRRCIYKVNSQTQAFSDIASALQTLELAGEMGLQTDDVRHSLWSIYAHSASTCGDVDAVLTALKAVGPDRLGGSKYQNYKDAQRNQDAMWAEAACAFAKRFGDPIGARRVAERIQVPMYRFPTGVTQLDAVNQCIENQKGTKFTDTYLKRDFVQVLETELKVEAELEAMVQPGNPRWAGARDGILEECRTYYDATFPKDAAFPILLEYAADDLSRPLFCLRAWHKHRNRLAK